VRPSAKVTADSQVIYEKSIGTKMNDPDLCLEVVSKVMSTIASHSPLNISEIANDKGLVPKDHQ